MYEKTAQKPSSIHRYSREKMMVIRESRLSRTRPSILSAEFNNEDGLFSPDKWLQYRWQCEGVVNRIGLKKKPNSTSRSENVASSHDVDQTVLSPQRRGFSCGCRAPSPKPAEDEKSNAKSRWRHGHLSNGVDFKPPFQKNALEQNRNRSLNNPSVWRNNHPTSEKSWNNDKLNNRNNRNNYDEKSERMPEWLDEGPSSMTDIIELKGFEDDVKEKKSKKRKGKDSTSKSTSQPPATNSYPDEGTPSNNSRRRHGGRLRNSRSNSTQGGSRPPSCLEFGVPEDEVRQASNEEPTNELSAAINHVNLEQKASKNSCEVLPDVMSTLLSVNANDAAPSISPPLAESVVDSLSRNTSDVQSLPLLQEMNASSIVSTAPNNMEPTSSFINNFPNSDAEFAAYLGILDIDPATIKNENLGPVNSEPSCSRLSRFFCRNSQVQQTPKEDKNFLLDAFNANQQRQTLSSTVLSNLQHRPIVGQNLSGGDLMATNSNSSNNNNNDGNVLPPALKELFAAAAPKNHSMNNLNGGMTVEELERELSYKFNENMGLNEQQQQFHQQQLRPQQSGLIIPEHFTNQVHQQRLQLQQQLANLNKLPPELHNMDPMAAAAMMHHAAYIQQNLMLMQQQEQQQQHSSARHPMLQKLLTNSKSTSGMTVEELEREQFGCTAGMDEVLQQPSAGGGPPLLPEHLPPEIQQLIQQRIQQQQQQAALLSGGGLNNGSDNGSGVSKLPPELCNVNPMASAAMIHHATLLQQMTQQQQQYQHRQQPQQQPKHPMLQKLLSNAPVNQKADLNGGFTVQELEREIAMKAANRNLVHNQASINQMLTNNCGGFSMPAPPANFPALLMNNIGKELTPQQQQQLMDHFLAARPFLEHQHQQNPQAALMHLAHLQQSLFLLARLLAAGNSASPDVNHMRALLAQLMQHDPTAVASFLARNGNFPGGQPAQQFPFIPQPPHLAQNFPTNQQTSNETATNRNQNSPLQHQSAQSSHSQQSGVGNSSPSINTMAAFMPTAVMRQMTKVPGGGSSVNSFSESSARNTPAKKFFNI